MSATFNNGDHTTSIYISVVIIPLCGMVMVMGSVLTVAPTAPERAGALHPLTLYELTLTLTT